MECNLRERVDTLERQNRRYKRLGFIVLILAACAVFMAQAAPKKVKVVEAEDFVLRDSDGHIRARLGMWTGQQASFALYDANGTPSVLIDGNGPSVHITDPVTKLAGAGMFISSTGPAIQLFGKQGQPGVLLDIDNSKGIARIAFHDGRLVSRVGMGVIGDDASIQVTDGNGKPRVAMGFTANMPSIQVIDGNGSPIWWAPTATTAGATESRSKPRVAIESWESEEAAGIFAARPPRQNGQALDEMPMFIQRCPQVASALERRQGDYVLRFDHHESQGSYSYGYTLFDGGGGSLGAASGLSLSVAIDRACQGILTDWGSKVR